MSLILAITRSYAWSCMLAPIPIHTQIYAHSLTHSHTHTQTNKRPLTHSLLPHLYVAHTGAQAIAAGSKHSLVLKTDGTVWGTGNNYYGQLGDGTNTHRNTFVNVLPGQTLTSYTGVQAIAAGEDHSLVVKTDGTVWGTGKNHCGQLGDGDTVDRNEFVYSITAATVVSSLVVLIVTVVSIISC